MCAFPYLWLQKVVAWIVSDLPEMLHGEGGNNNNGGLTK